MWRGVEFADESLCMIISDFAALFGTPQSILALPAQFAPELYVSKQE